MFAMNQPLDLYVYHRQDLGFRQLFFGLRGGVPEG